MSPYAVVAGDFNGDLGPDLAAVTVPARLVRTEGISRPDLVTGSYAPFAAAADFNGDGLDDLVSNGVLLLRLS